MIRIVFFLSLLGAMALGNLAWWRHQYVKAAALKRRRLIRIAIGLWSGVMFAGLATVILTRPIDPAMLKAVPKDLLGAVYVWHFLFVLPWVVWRAGRIAVLGAWWGIKQLATAKPALNSARDEQAAEQPATLTSRRQFLAATAIAAPPVLASLAAWRGVTRLDHFRINHQHLTIPGLPRALEGLKIAHVTDIHIGHFTDDALLRKIAEQTNLLQPDLVLMTGDLIDFNLADLPGGLDMIDRLNPRYGVVMCEGNHDLFQSREGFARQVALRGVPMPINRSHSLTIRGQEVQVLGLRWGGASTMSLSSSETLIAESMGVLMPQVKPGAFPILLAHHPHAFDYIGDAQVPLTLAGHTHGGQLNPPLIQPARLRFRYLSGLYEKAGRKLFVSNGVGNWFPLRVNAPAEIVNITLAAG